KRQRTVERQGNVLSGSQRVEQRKMLKNHAYAKFSCGGRFVYRNRLPLPDDFAFKWLQRAEQHFHKGGFSGTVFTQKRVNFAFPDGEIDTIAGPQLTKYFREPADIQKRPVG